MKLLSAVALLSVVALTGCMSVPATRVKFDPATHTLDLSSPKDTTISNLVAEVKADGSATITLNGYESKNNVEVISAIAKANADTRADAAAAGDRVLEKVISTLAK